MIKKVIWDSDFFNLNIGELDFNKTCSSINCGGFDLLYVSSTRDFDLKLEGFENSFSEQKIKFYKDLNETNRLSGNVFSCLQTKYDLQEVYELAYESGKHSRFLLDRNFF